MAGRHPVGNRQAGGVVLGAVDAQAGGKSLQRCAEGAARRIEVALGIQRLNVGIDDGWHFDSPFVSIT